MAWIACNLPRALAFSLATFRHALAFAYFDFWKMKNWNEMKKQSNLNQILRFKNEIDVISWILYEESNLKNLYPCLCRLCPFRLCLYPCLFYEQKWDIIKNMKNLLLERFLREKIKLLLLFRIWIRREKIIPLPLPLPPPAAFFWGRKRSRGSVWLGSMYTLESSLKIPLSCPPSFWHWMNIH